MKNFKMNMKTLATEVKKKVEAKINQAALKKSSTGCSTCGKK